MDRKHLRIGVLSAGVISGLLLLLYLPVLIWSPPWGENGYYTKSTNWPVFFSWHNGNAALIHMDGNLENTMFNFHYIAGEWRSKKMEKHPYAIDMFKLKFERDSVKYSFFNLKSSDWDSLLLIKTSNPFTLWHIKWLEWTAE